MGEGTVDLPRNYSVSKHIPHIVSLLTVSLVGYACTEASQSRGLGPHHPQLLRRAYAWAGGGTCFDSLLPLPFLISFTLVSGNSQRYGASEPDAGTTCPSFASSSDSHRATDHPATTFVSRHPAYSFYPAFSGTYRVAPEGQRCHSGGNLGGIVI